MKKNRLLQSVIAIGFAAGLGSTPVGAHHSFSAEFDAAKFITLKGTLIGAELVNPHGWLHLEVKDASGKTVKWAVEVGGANALYRRGWRASELPIGKPLIVEGYLAKDGSPTMNGVSITFEDGRKLFANSSAPGAEGGDEPPQR